MNLASHMGAVAHALLGEPNKALSSRRALRYGTNGSLSIDLEKGTFYDHENQTGGGVLGLIAREKKLSNGEALDWMRSELRADLPDNARQEVATYPYTDADGKLLFEVVRFDPKDFRQRRPDGHGGWIWNVKGVPAVPFHLPELLAANNRTIHIVEGEKDVHALERMGLVATCNPGGAGKWKPKFAQFFVGADVVVLPDNDPTGEDHARQVAANLSPGASRVRIVHLPNLPPKGDVSDWIARGGTAEALAKLCEEPPEDVTEFGEWDAGEDSDTIPPRGWLLGNSFCRKFVSSLLGAGGTGKTATRIAQLLSLAAGRALTGEHVFQRCRCLIVSLEDDADELRRRILAARKHHGIAKIELKGWLFLASLGAKGGKLMVADRGSVTRGALADQLEAVIARRKIDVVSLDPFVKTHSVEENANSAIDDVVQVLSDIAVKYDCAIDVPHHISKGSAEAGNADRGRGASAAKDAMRLVYTLTPMTPEEAKTFGISEELRRSLVRMDSGKVNIAPPMTAAKWFRLIGVPLGNATQLYPHGDEVQTVEPWTPPDSWAGISNFIANQILSDIDKGTPDGERYSDAPAATDRAAWTVVAKHVPGKDEGPAKQIIRAWKKTGLLYLEDYESPSRRRPVKGLKVDPKKRPS